jgi:D-glycero-alpha-D-manno-heptose-7-phosphate kinase
MIISRTPYRISFFGGGTDYQAWYQVYGGAVLSTTINHYCYLTCRYLPPFFKEKSRIVWSQIEKVMDNSEIVHPAVRAVLQYFANERNGVEVSHSGDLPARSGLGSSSAFTVGLLNAMSALQGRMSNKRELACEAVHIERDILKENVGVQDQIATAYGGFNKITIMQNGDFGVEPVILTAPRQQELQSHFLLFFTGVSRNASDIAKDQVNLLTNKKAELEAMRQLVDEALGVVMHGPDFLEFGRLLHESWQLKRSLCASIAPDFVDDIYNKARAAGAIGGKLLGAGGGGFMLFFAPPEQHPAIRKALANLLWVPFQFETGGSNIIFYDPASYSHDTFTRRDFYHLDKRNDAAPHAARGDNVLPISLKKRILTV